METVLIAGGTGLVGQYLSPMLEKKGYKVIHLSRSPDHSAKYPKFGWDIEQGEVEEQAIHQADYVVNVAGAGIADWLWSKSRKQLIRDSRIKATEVLFKAFHKGKKKPKAYISASAIGYYGDRGEEWLTESAPPGQEGFLPEVCRDWENAALSFEEWGVRTGIVRIGIVLSTQGGALPKMLLSFKLNTGAYFGDGTQFYSWIHLDDLCRLFIQIIENAHYTGPYNGVAPNPVRNKTFIKDIGEALGKKSLILPVPAFALRLTMGEMADVVLDSARVSSEKIEQSGFKFRFPDLIPALHDLIRRQV